MVLNVKLKKHKNDLSSDMLGLLNEIIVQVNDIKYLLHSLPQLNIYMYVGITCQCIILLFCMVSMSVTIFFSVSYFI